MAIYFLPNCSEELTGALDCPLSLPLSDPITGIISFVP
jgi:hypothetical protein